MALGRERKTFRRPGRRYGPLSFWRWNGRLDTDRLLRQLDQLLEAGMGGVVLDGGLEGRPGEYGAEEWLHAVAAVAKRARKGGASIGLYDKAGALSGPMMGRAPDENPELCGVHLLMEDVTLGDEHPETVLPGDAVAAFVVTRNDPVHGVQQRDDGGVTLVPDRIRCVPIVFDIESRALAGHRVLTFRMKTDSDRFNYLDARGAKRFLERVHETYYRHLKRYTGGTITGCFTGEAGLAPGPSELPWDLEIETLFRETRGYSLAPHLPALFFDVPGCEAVRFDFWTLVAEMFREGFAVPLQTWCADHKLAFSGSCAFQVPLKEATWRLGSALPVVGHQDPPSVDIPGGDVYSRRLSLETYGNHVVAIKQAASVSHQLGKGGLFSQSHGGAGYGLTIEDMQAGANFQMALGVTTMVYREAPYSVQGKSIHDGPCVIGPQQPYWPFIAKHLSTVSRTSWLLGQGQHVCKVLFVHPAASLQATYRRVRRPQEYKGKNYFLDADLPFEVLDKHFTLLSIALLDAQIDFDYGGEEILASHGRAQGNLVKVGEQGYGIVLVPPAVNLRSTTLALLQDMAMGGGNVLFVGSPPTLLDGRPSGDASAFVDDYATRVVDGVERYDYEGVVRVLSGLGARTVTATDEDGEDVPALKVQRRLWEDREIVFLANVSREKQTARIRFGVSVDGRLEEWDLTAGETTPVAACSSGEELDLALEWDDRQARAFVAVPGDDRWEAEAPYAEVLRVRPQWRGRRTELNVLVLDECILVDEEGGGRRLSVSQARRILEERIEQAKGPVLLTTEWPFDMSAIIPVSGPCEAAVQLARDAVVWLNGEELPTEDAAWVMDPAIARINLPQLWMGRNTLEVRAAYMDAGELASPWIRGDFWVETRDNVRFVLEFDAGGVAMGEWPKLGMPFYAGTVVYSALLDGEELGEDRRVVLEMPGLMGAAEVRVNGKVVDHVLWPPYRCDVTKFWGTEALAIEIEVANTLRNLLGPHFDPDEESKAVFSSESFEGKAGQPRRFCDYGLSLAPELVFSLREAASPASSSADNAEP